MSPSLTRLLTAAEALAEALEQETRSLRHGRPAELAPAVAEKAARAQRYQEALAAVRAAGALPAAPGAPAHARLRRAALRLEQALAANRRHLDAGRKACGRLLRLITGATPAPGYDVSGRLRPDTAAALPGRRL